MNLLIAEDTKDMNKALTAVLTHEGYEVDSVFDGIDAENHLQQNVYDVVILDIMMPGKNGLEVLKDLRKTGDSTPVLLLTAKAEVDDRVTGLDAGADDYLPKPFSLKELLARVRSLGRRSAQNAAEDLRFGDFSMRSDGLEIVSENSVRLSAKEFELLQVLVQNSTRPLSTQWLLDHVWHGEDEGPDTVTLYISYLRGKLRSIASSVTIDETAEGYILKDSRKAVS
ncbi:MAG: response regulator transcription factor [Lachnospiraceae bacterium]|jgi:DNA-binding response OmpR family regulator